MKQYKNFLENFKHHDQDVFKNFSGKTLRNAIKDDKEGYPPLFCRHAGSLGHTQFLAAVMLGNQDFVTDYVEKYNEEFALLTKTGRYGFIGYILALEFAANLNMFALLVQLAQRYKLFIGGEPQLVGIFRNLLEAGNFNGFRHFVKEYPAIWYNFKNISQIIWSMCSGLQISKREYLTKAISFLRENHYIDNDTLRSLLEEESILEAANQNSILAKILMEQGYYPKNLVLDKDFSGHFVPLTLEDAIATQKMFSRMIDGNRRWISSLIVVTDSKEIESLRSSPEELEHQRQAMIKYKNDFAQISKGVMTQEEIDQVLPTLENKVSFFQKNNHGNALVFLSYDDISKTGEHELSGPYSVDKRLVESLFAEGAYNKEAYSKLLDVLKKMPASKTRLNIPLRQGVQEESSTTASQGEFKRASAGAV